MWSFQYSVITAPFFFFNIGVFFPHLLPHTQLFPVFWCVWVFMFLDAMLSFVDPVPAYFYNFFIKNEQGVRR